MMSWFNLELDEVKEKLAVDLENGLSVKEIEERRQTYGLNVLPEKAPLSLAALFRAQIIEPLVLILIVAAIISGVLGEIGDTFLILVIVLLNAILGVLQERKAEKAIKALKEMTKVYVKVKREGLITEIPAENLVPGDLIFLEAGDAVPADARLLKAVSLKVSEAALTGEAVGVDKHVEVISDESVLVAERKNMVFMGTIVTSGRGEAVVTTTGLNTELGKIAQLLTTAPKEETPLQVELAKLGKSLGFVALVIVLVVFLLGVLKGEAIFEMFMIAVALAVAAIPEGLPAVVTIVLALGVTRMSKQKAVIRKLPAVETLGAATYICSDKTGTLTQNEMTVSSLYFPDELITVSQGEQVLAEQKEGLLLLLLGGLLNNDAYLTEDGIIGDPTEGALVAVAAKAGLHKREVEKAYLRLHEIPFDSARKMMTTFWEKDNEYYSFTKGAPDFLLAACNSILTPQGEQILDSKWLEKLAKINQGFALKGQRVLGVAGRKWPQMPQDFGAQIIENGLTFWGFFALEDPPRREAQQAVQACQKAGIKTVMITGDHRDTAVAIARRLGIWQKGDQVLSGGELKALSQLELEKRVEKITVYARVSPEDKLRIVAALKAKGQIVAMTGDGVNDAPALKRADIGVSMGLMGTEVAKEAADLVLLDDNFATIVKAVEEGRAIYDNIRKAVKYLLSCNLGEIVVIFGGLLLGRGIPLLPGQILWLNLVTDSAPALALGVQPSEKGIMERPPRKLGAGILAEGVGPEILWQGLLIGLLSLVAFGWGETLSEARTMVFMTLGLSQLIHAFNLQNRRESVFSSSLSINGKLIWASLICGLLQLSVVFVPFLRTIFKTSWLGLAEWLVVLVLSVLPLVIMEIVKYFRRTELFSSKGVYGFRK